METLIGFIGQGWIGKHYADDFEQRGHQVVRYALEAPYCENKAAIRDCTIVFIAVPTPTTATGFSYTSVQAALKNLAPGTTAVIKSTILPGITQQLQAEFPELYVMHSPEFLREATAAHDAAHPDRNIIGIPQQTAAFTRRAEAVLAVLPPAAYQTVMPALEAELVKYVGNCFLYAKVVMMNTFHDMISAAGADWETVRTAMVADPRIGDSHTQPVHTSGHDSGGVPKRGAGGHCFIKDFEAFRQFHAAQVGDTYANELLLHMVEYNNALLVRSGKDLDLLAGVYGEALIHKHQL